MEFDLERAMAQETCAGRSTSGGTGRSRAGCSFFLCYGLRRCAGASHHDAADGDLRGLLQARAA